LTTALEGLDVALRKVFWSRELRPRKRAKPRHPLLNEVWYYLVRGGFSYAETFALVPDDYGWRGGAERVRKALHEKILLSAVPGERHPDFRRSSKIPDRRRRGRSSR
jgi:hypothetical protein